MALHLDRPTNWCPAARWALSATTLALAGLLGCGLIGVEPDEIDVLEGTSDGTPNGGDGDGDGDGGTSMSTGVTTDPAGSSETNATEDSATDSAGESEGAESAPCGDLDPTFLELGENAIAFPPGDSFYEGSCGGAGAEQLYVFESDFEAEMLFQLNGALAEDAVLYVVDECEPLSELACGAPAIEGIAVQPGDSVYVFIDLLDADAGASGELLVLTL